MPYSYDCKHFVLISTSKLILKNFIKLYICLHNSTFVCCNRECLQTYEKKV